MRQVQFTHLHLEVALFGDLDGVVDRLGIIFEQLGHFLGRFEINLIGIVLHPVGIGNQLAGLNTEQGIMGLGISLFQIMAVIGGRDGDSGLSMHGINHRQKKLFFIQTVVLHLEIEVTVTKNIIKFAGGLDGTIGIATQQMPVDLAFHAGGQGD